MKIKDSDLLRMDSLKIESLAFIYLIAIVIRNGMSILGVSLPEKCNE